MISTLMRRSLQICQIYLIASLGIVFQNLRRSPRRRNAIIFTSLFILGYFTVYRSNNWYVIYRFLPEERGFLPELTNETLVCKDLLKSARRILDGEPIPLPYSEGTPEWIFKETASKELIKRNILCGENLTDSASRVLKKLQYFNVNSSEVKGSKMLITFGHNCCAYSKQRALFKAKTVGEFDYVHSFDVDAMTPRFRYVHNDVLKSERGAGYWLWKPYILLKTLIENMNEDDIVMYQDAGAYLLRSAGPLLKLCEQSENGIVVFSLRKIERDYTKQDAFILMNVSFPEVTETFQRLASFVVLRKTCSSIQFIMEWLAYLSDRRIASDDTNTLGIPNPESFVAHRHDQSVMSLLSKKWGLPACRDPSQFGETVAANRYYSTGPYKQIFMHDRFKL